MKIYFVSLSELSFVGKAVWNKLNELKYYKKLVEQELHISQVRVDRNLLLKLLSVPVDLNYFV